MRVPPFDRWQKMMRVTVFFIFGMLVGSALYGALKNNIVDQVLFQNSEMKEQIMALKKELEFAHLAHKENVIRNVIVIFIHNSFGEEKSIDILTEKELKKRLRMDLEEIFIGRSIYMINTDANIARKLLNTKMYGQIENQNYDVTIRTMLVVDGVLQVWAEPAIHRTK